MLKFHKACGFIENFTIELIMYLDISGIIIVPRYIFNYNSFQTINMQQEFVIILYIDFGCF